MSCKNGAALLSPGHVREGGLMAAREVVMTESRDEGKARPPRLDVQTLLRGGREAILLKGTDEYRLRLTSNGKLILTK
jgi:hemin uptake protein HemP